MASTQLRRFAWLTLFSAGLLLAPWRIGASGLRLQGCRRQHRNTSTRRKKIGWCGFQPSKPIDQLPAAADDLAGQPHEGVHERLELQPQHPAFLRPVLLLPAARLLRQRQRPPGLQVPGQGRHHHVGPVALQVVHRRTQRPHAAVQLREQVLLIAAVVGRRRRSRPRRSPSRW